MTTYEYWSKRLDPLCKKIVKLNGRCARCQSRFSLEWSHIITRGERRIKWDLQNCMCLCHFCHVYFTQHPAAWDLFVKDKIGEDLYWELRRRANDRTSKIDYRAIEEYLKNQLSLVQAVKKYNHFDFYFSKK